MYYLLRHYLGEMDRCAKHQATQRLAVSQLQGTQLDVFLLVQEQPSCQPAQIAQTADRFCEERLKDR
jgi:hypothetical protein